LADYYLTNFSLYYDLKKDPTMFDNMMPFERSIYLDLLQQRLQEEKNNKQQPSMPTAEEYE